jgi:hypothetical protein
MEIRKTVISFEECDLIELERIMVDEDTKQAFLFLKKSVYDRILHSQQGKLKSHLDTPDNPVEQFKQ